MFYIDDLSDYEPNDVAEDDEENYYITYEQALDGLTQITNEGVEVTGFELGAFLHFEGDEFVAAQFLKELKPLLDKYQCYDVCFCLSGKEPEGVTDRSDEDLGYEGQDIVQDEQGFILSGAAFVAPPEDDDDHLETA